MVRIVRLRAEYRSNTIGIGAERPRLSWTIDADGTDLIQAAYEITVERAGGVESSGRVTSPDQVFVAWPGRPLASREAVHVRVRSWLSDGRASEWSDPLTIEAGLLHDDDWQVGFVSASPCAEAAGVRPAHLLRTGFDLPADLSDVVRARVYATAHGLYTLELNGRQVSDDELAPGWTSYGHRLRYQVYDVLEQLRAGANAIGAVLADGWYRGRIGFHGGLWDVYGPDLSLLLQLELTRADGSVELAPLQPWRTAPSPIVATSIYDGEHFDARLAQPGWSAPGFDASAWSPAEVIPRERFTARLEAAIGEPVRVVEYLDPIAVETRPGGRIRLDFGQNIAGRLRIRIDAPPGHTVRLHHAEVLEFDELATRPLREAPSIDAYTADGRGPADWQPRFTFHGFRYAELENWPGELNPGDVQAAVVHTDMRRTGWFSSSDPLLDRLHENTVWSMRDNFVDLPTDCPQRDERLGWTGDIQVFAPAATFLYRSDGVLATWLRDLAAEQKPDGAVPNFVPWLACGFPEPSSAAWGDAAAIVPWTMYERYGDVGVLAEQFTSMKAWVEHLAGMRDVDGLIRDGFQLGDWLDPAAPPERPGDARTDKYLVANAYLVRSARIVAQVADLLDRPADAAWAARIADDALAAFGAAYLTADGGVIGETPTALSLAIIFDLLATPEQRRRAGSRLAELVAEGGYRIQTGFVGTPIICDALASTGQMDAAYRLLGAREVPSWLYPVTMGATTIWERWDSMLPDGSVNPGDMTSFNHYALGAVVDFLHRVVAGLAPAAPGYRALRIAPRPGGGLDHAAATFETPYGRARSGWTVTGTRFSLEVEVPVGVVADVWLPDGSDARRVGSGRHVFDADLPAVPGGDHVTRTGAVSSTHVDR